MSLFNSMQHDPGFRRLWWSLACLYLLCNTLGNLVCPAVLQQSGIVYAPFAVLIGYAVLESRQEIQLAAVAEAAEKGEGVVVGTTAARARAPLPGWVGPATRLVQVAVVACWLGTAYYLVHQWRRDKLPWQGSV